MVRLAELIAALSLATDLGMGQPMEHGLRTTLLSLRLGHQLGLPNGDMGDLYYVSLLRWVGCTSHAHELARWFGDDIAAHARAATFDFGRPLEVVADMLRHAGEGRPPLARARAVAEGLAGGKAAVGQLFLSSCEVAQNLADRLGFGANVTVPLGHMFERWDGRGWPRGLRGDELDRSIRVVHVAQDAEVFHRVGGVDAAVTAIEARSGSLYEPAVATLFCRHARSLFEAVDARSTWEAVLAVEPGEPARVADIDLDRTLTAIADFADLKSPFTAGHSRGVAAVAEAAAVQARMPAAEVTSLRRAALLHDLGRTGVPNGIWDKPGPLTDGEWERVRLHPYLTQRMLTRAEALRPLANLASFHHERLDGSGYHRGVAAATAPRAARILATADAYHAMLEPRAYREPRSRSEAATHLRQEVKSGRLDAEAVEAVLAGAGHRRSRRRGQPAGLTNREADVLRLVARGLSNREVGERLHISTRTAGHHVQHIYTKIGVATRAGATLFAMQHGLLQEIAET